MVPQAPQWRPQALVSQHPAVVLDPAEEGAPLRPGPAVVHQKMRAIFVRRVFAAARPMVVRDDIAQRDAVALHDDGGEFGRALNGGPQVAAAILAHFDADRQAVSRAVEIRVFALLVGRHVLDRLMVVHGEMPDQVTYAVAVG